MWSAWPKFYFHYLVTCENVNQFKLEHNFCVVYFIWTYQCATRVMIPDPIAYLAPLLLEENDRFDNVCYLSQCGWPQPLITILSEACEMFGVQRLEPVCFITLFLACLLVDY